MKNIREPIKFFAAGLAFVLLPVGLIVLSLAAFEYSLSRTFSTGEDEADILSEQISPNGASVATVFVFMGGGAAGWCYNQVNVRPVDSLLSNREYVFSTSCGSKIDVKWESDSLLHVSYKNERDYPSFSYKKYAMNGAVRIFYSEK